MVKENVWGIFLVLIIFNCVLLHFNNLARKRFFQPIPSSKRLMIFLLLTFLGIIGLQQGDYFGYLDEVKEIARTPESYGRVTHLEPQYETLARIVNGNYILWRFIIFGGQFAILLYYLRKSDLFTYGYLFFFSSICLSGMIVGRTSWGVVLFFCSIYYALQNKDYKHILVAPLCLFSHTSLVVLLAIIPLVFFRINKKSFLFFLILFFVLTYALKYVFDNIPMLSAYEQAEILSQKMESYTDPNRENAIGFWGNSIGAKLTSVPQKTGLLALLIILLYTGYKNKERVEKGIHFLLLACLFLVMFSFVMLNGKFGAGTLSYRFFDMIHLPISIAFYYYYRNGLVSKRLYSFFITIFIISLEFSLIVPLYYNSL